ncbi:hypothetical protein EV360DRAFT_75655 [Lentinula raphanica]|nr:hypothetical protein EV360DRAFT_75655 [Lentinula raphanica]
MKAKPVSSKLSAKFFDNNDDEEPPSFPYTARTHRKSRREKEHEAAEAKKREEELNAAKAYAEFIDAFEGGDVNRKSTSDHFVKAESGSKYVPTVRGFQQERSHESRTKLKEKLNILGITSNVFVANLPPNVTEQSLGNFFARAGPVGSEALREFDGLDWGGFVLRVSWNKAVPIAANPMYVRGRSLKPFQCPMIHDPNTEVGVGVGARIDHIEDRDVLVNATVHILHATEGIHQEEVLAHLRWTPRTRRPQMCLFALSLSKSKDMAGRLTHKSYRNLVKMNDLYDQNSMTRGIRTGTDTEDHAREISAEEMADILAASLLVEGIPVPRKVARLHLICDILHNSAATVHSAWKYRQEFQSRLGRITAETFKKQVTTVVDIWEDWIVFPPAFTSELRVRLEGMSMEDKTEEMETAEDEAKAESAKLPSRFTNSTFKAASESASNALVNEDLDGAARRRCVISDIISIYPFS